MEPIIGESERRWIALRTVGFNALNRIPGLNTLVSLLTSGRVNKLTVAQSVLQRSVALASRFPMVQTGLGASTERVMQLISDKFVHGKDMDTGELTNTFVQMAYKRIADTNTSANGVVAAGIQVGLNVADSTLSPREIRSETVLKTLLAKHGWTEIDAFIDKHARTQAPFPYICEQVKAMLHLVVDHNLKDLKPESSRHDTFLADVAHTGLTGGDWKAAMARAFPRAAAIVQTGVAIATAVVETGKSLMTIATNVKSAVVENASHVSNLARDAIDDLQEKLGVGLMPVPLHEAYAGALSPPSHAASEHAEASEITPPEKFGPKVDDRTMADAYLKERALAQHPADPQKDPEAGVPVDVQSYLNTNLKIDHDEHPEQVNQLSRVHQTLTDILTPPIGERCEVSVAHSLTGRLKTVSATSHHVAPINFEKAENIEKRLATAPEDYALFKGYSVSERFAQQIDTLTLDVGVPEQSYTQLASRAGTAMWSTGLQLFGYQATPVVDDHPHLSSLFALCGEQKDMMSEVSRFLDADWVNGAVQKNMTLVQDGASSLCKLPDHVVQVRGAPPQTRFKVERQDKDNAHSIVISVDLEWDIEKVGKDEASLTSLKGATGDTRGNKLSHACTIIVRQSADKLIATCVSTGFMTSVAQSVHFNQHDGSFAGRAAEDGSTDTGRPA